MTKSENVVERRSVLLAGGAVAATAALTGCVVQEADPVATTPTPTQPVPPASQPTTGPPTQSQQLSQPPSQQPALAKVADIPAGGGVILTDKNVVLTKDQSGKVAAFSAVCTHQGCVIVAVSNGTINCPCHGSKFDAATGQRVAGPAKDPLPAVAVRQRDGSIFQA